MDRKILTCDCTSIEHQIVFSFDPNYKHVHAYIHLMPLPFLKRLSKGVRYIIGYKSKYGAFEEFIFTHQDADKVKELYQYLHAPIKQ